MGSLPNKLFGDYGDEKVAQSTKIGSLPLGIRMVLPDGREYVHAKAGASALVAGCLYEGAAGEANTTFIKSLAVSAASAAATSVVVTKAAGTTLVADVYADGYIFFSAGSSSGSVYKVKSHTGVASTAAGTVTVSFTENDKLAEGLAAGTTTAGMRKNLYDSVVITTNDTVSVNALAGVPPRDVTEAYYCWLQKKGYAACLTDNTTLIVGVPVTASSTVAGAIGVENITLAGTAWAATALVHKGIHSIGYCVSVAASAEYSLIDLDLP